VELAREAERCEREARLHPLRRRRQLYVEALFAACIDPVIAVTDYQKALPASTAGWVPASFQQMQDTHCGTKSSATRGRSSIRGRRLQSRTSTTCITSTYRIDGTPCASSPGTV
jgi:pyruvate dehydrogenase complex dehydrogenase (E1) component